MKFNPEGKFVDLLLLSAALFTTVKVKLQQKAVDELQVKCYDRYVILHPKVLNGCNRSISVDHLPCFEEENKATGCIVASCDNLILCFRRGPDNHGIYDLCDPYTKQWVQLPPAPSDYSFIHIGMICDPADDYVPKGLGEAGLKPRQCDSANFVDQLARRRFRVVHVLKPPVPVFEAIDEFDIEMLSCDSGSWQWTHLRMRSPQPMRWRTGMLLKRAVACNGLIHWLNGSLELVVYDPYQNEVKAVIPRPSEGMFFLPLVVLVASCGSVWVIEYMHRSEPGRWYSWQLSPDYDGWILRRRVYQAHMMSDLMAFMNERPMIPFAQFLAVHPNNHNIIYFTCSRELKASGREFFMVCFDMATETFQVVGKTARDFNDWQSTFVLTRPSFWIM